MITFGQYLETRIYQPYQRQQWDDRFDKNAWELNNSNNIYYKNAIKANQAGKHYVLDKFGRVLRAKWDPKFPDNIYEFADFENLGNGSEDLYVTDSYGRNLFNKQKAREQEEEKNQNQRRINDQEASQNLNQGNILTKDVSGKVTKDGTYRILLVGNKIIFQDFNIPHAQAYGTYGLNTVINRKTGQGAIHGFFERGNVTFRRDDNPKVPDESAFKKAAKTLASAGFMDGNSTITFPVDPNLEMTYTVNDIDNNTVGQYQKFNAEKENRGKLAAYGVGLHQPSERVGPNNERLPGKNWGRERWRGTSENTQW